MSRQRVNIKWLGNHGSQGVCTSTLGSCKGSHSFPAKGTPESTRRTLIRGSAAQVPGSSRSGCSAMAMLKQASSCRAVAVPLCLVPCADGIGIVTKSLFACLVMFFSCYLPGGKTCQRARSLSLSLSLSLSVSLSSSLRCEISCKDQLIPLHARLSVWPCVIFGT